MLSLAELAVTYALGSELLLNTIKARMGSTIRGRLEGSLLYTPAVSDLGVIWCHVLNVAGSRRHGQYHSRPPRGQPALHAWSVSDLG